MLLSLLLSLAAPAHAALIKTVTWTASSTAPAEEKENYEATRLGDGKQSTAWMEGEQGSGLNSWVLADFGAEKSLQQMVIWPGYWYNSEYWKRYNRVKSVTLEFSDGSKQEVPLEDKFAPQTVALNGKKTKSVKITIKTIYAGNTFSDSSLAEVQFFDGAATDYVATKGIGASSTFPPDGDGDYSTDNLQDGILDSMWCENDKGDGTGQWVEYSFAAPTSVSQWVINNGNAYSFQLYQKTNRPVAATLAFSDGSTETVTIKDLSAKQTIPFPAHTTDKVKVTFTTVKKGAEFNDLCLSEAYFLP